MQRPDLLLIKTSSIGIQVLSDSTHITRTMVSTSSNRAENVRTKIAKAVAEVIPFSCIICFDEFNTTTRPPMVLPCGHTYVCLPCTKRLKRCMECREPLFLQTQPQHKDQYHHPPAPAVLGSSRNARFSPAPPASPQARAPKPISTPLPIPKNLVLLAMMEATERQMKQLQTPTKDEEHENRACIDDDYSVSVGVHEEDEEDQDEEEAFSMDRVIAGMSTMAGACGTYAVRDREGLLVFPNDPRENKEETAAVLKESSSANLENQMSEIDGVKQSPSRSGFHDEFKGEIELEHVESPSSQLAHTGSSDMINQSALCSDADSQDAAAMPPPPPRHGSTTAKPFRVEFGQKLQIVAFEDDVAVLARNQGFVCASKSQLAKVGAPLDDSCRLEGMLCTIQAREKELQNEAQENQIVQSGLRERIQHAQTMHPSYPIISELPLPDSQEAKLLLAKSTSMDRQTSPDYMKCPPSTPPPRGLLQPSLQTPDSGSYFRQGLESDAEYHGYIQATSTCPAMPSSPHSVDNADIQFVQGQRTTGLTFGCGSNLLSSDFLTADEHLHRQQRNASAAGVFVKTLGGSPDSHRLAHSPSHGPPAASASASFDSVNFRTGMSGHGALSASKRNVKNSPTPYAHARSNARPKGRMLFSGHHGLNI